jgi:SAM-dependent methyltransferase
MRHQKSPADSACPQNIYDHPDFFAGYSTLREQKAGINEAIEEPALGSLLTPLQGLDIVDLGCGTGGFVRQCAVAGARTVIGVDVSTRMLAQAQKLTTDDKVRYMQASIEDVEFKRASIDLVVSSLALHYISDYEGVVARIHDWLRPGGIFVYSVEHPVMTAQRSGQGWHRNSEGDGGHWELDDYADEGPRQRQWFIEGVLKYHRRVATLLNGLIEAGFNLEKILEPEPTKRSIRERPELLEHARRPPLLLVRARRTDT